MIQNLLDTLLLIVTITLGSVATIVLLGVLVWLVAFPIWCLLNYLENLIEKRRKREG